MYKPVINEPVINDTEGLLDPSTLSYPIQSHTATT